MPNICYEQPILQDYIHVSQDGVTYKRCHANQTNSSTIAWFCGLGFTPTLKITILEHSDALSVTWQLTCRVIPERHVLWVTPANVTQQHTDKSFSNAKCIVLPGPEPSEAASRQKFCCPCVMCITCLCCLHHSWATTQVLRPHRLFSSRHCAALLPML